MRRRNYLLLILWCGVFGLVGPLAALGEDPHPFVYRHAVSLPIILSAPHGGKLAIPGVPVRTGEGQVKAAGKFVASRDTGTEELAHAVSDAIECATSKLARSRLIAKQSTTFFLLDRNIQQ